MANESFTLERIEGALEELTLLMSECDGAQLAIYAAIYAKAYTMKLNLLAKENKDASH